jgi:hypothetical protein
MRKAIGFLIVLWGLSIFFDNSVPALDRAATASFETIEVVAEVSQQKILQQSK